MSRLGVGSFVLVTILFAACGGSGTTVGGDTDGGSTSSSGSPGGPDSGGSSSGDAFDASTGPAFSGEGAFIVRRFFAGETDRNGTKNTNAWKDYGRNIDGLTTVVNGPADLSQVCKRKQGAAASIHNDGNGGIDNAWGSQIVKMMDPFQPTPSKGMTDGIASGARTAMISIKGKDGFFVYAEKSASSPTFAPTEKRNIAEPWMNGMTPRAIISAGTVTNGVYDSGVIPGEVLVALDANLTVPLRATRVSMKIDASGAATDGTISGVVETEVFVAAFTEYAHRLSTELCSGTTIEAILDSIRQSSDIMKDGTQDPNQECDGISVGLGFEAKPVVVGDIAPAPQPVADPCN